jgi:hypothetical protein
MQLRIVCLKTEPRYLPQTRERGKKSTQLQNLRLVLASRKDLQG